MRPARRTYWWPNPIEWSALHLEADYRAGHERGIEGIARAFALPPLRTDTAGFERHVIRKFPTALTWADPSGDGYATLCFDTSGSRPRSLDNLRASDGVAGAWGRDGFHIVAGDSLSRRNLSDLWRAFEALDVAILLGGATNNPFDRPGLTIAIASRVPEAIKSALLQEDLRRHDAATGDEGVHKAPAAGGQVEEALAGLLAPYVRADAIPDVMRRSVAALGGRSLLEAAEDGDLEEVHMVVRSWFDLRRVQP